MKTAIASATPWPYGPPGNLGPPPEELTFDLLVERVVTFSRDSLLDTGARTLWRPWQGGAAPAWADPRFNVIEVYGPNIVSLAMMFCPPSGAEAQDVDFCLLCWELYSLRSFAAPETWEADVERQRIKDRWYELLTTTPFGELDVDDVARQVRAIWMIGRLQANTHQAGVQFADDVLRVALLHEAMEALAPNPSRFEKLRDTYFCNDVFRLLGHGLSLLSRALSAGPEVCPGRFDVHDVDLGESGVIDFAQFGTLACTASSTFRSTGKDLLALPVHERKLHPRLDPLSKRPGILLDEWKDRRAYCYPAPRRLVRSFRSLFVDDFVEFLPHEPGLEPPSFLGEALHRHVSEAIAGLALVVDGDCPVSGKRPDAVWCGDRFGVVIEAKARLTPRNDPDCVTPDALLEAWRRAWEAVTQADAFLKDPSAKAWMARRSGRSPTGWVLAIVVDERGVAERTQFRHATSRWNLLSRTALSGVALLTLECVEAAVRTRTADSIAQEIARAWVDCGRDPLEQPPEEPDVRTIEQPEYQRRAAALLAR